MNDVSRIISELERQRTAIERAISALRDVAGSDSRQQSAPQRATTPAGGKKRQLSPEGRQRIIDATKKRWAAKRAAMKREAAAAQSGAKATAKQQKKS